MKNQIALLTGPRSFEIVDAPMPVVGPNDVLIKSCHVGVCGSDVEFYLDPTFHGRFHPDKPSLGSDPAQTDHPCVLRQAWIL